MRNEILSYVYLMSRFLLTVIQMIKQMHSYDEVLSMLGSLISPLLSKETCTSGFRLKILKFYFSIFHCHKAPRYFQWSTWIWMSAIVNNRVKVTELTITCDTYKPHIMLLFDYFFTGFTRFKAKQKKSFHCDNKPFLWTVPIM